MIFVICGIIILIVSFIIALVSLVREQEGHNKRVGQVSEPNLNSDSEQENIPADVRFKTDEVVEPQPNRYPSQSAPLPSANWQQKEPASSEEPFPWEKDQRLSGGFSLKDIKDRQ